VWPSFQWNTKPVKKLVRIMFPALFGIAVYQLNLIILRQLGSYLPEGQISYYYNADRLMQLALGIFSISIATAALPMMSEQTARGDRQGLMRTWLFSTKLTNFITIPAAWGLTLIAIPIVSTLYLHGQYHWSDVQWTAYATMAFAPGLLSIAISRTTIQVFFALEDLRTPVIAGAITVAVNLILGILLLRFQVVGLALSLTISSWFQTIILVIWLKIRMGKLGFRSLASSMMRQTGLAAFSTSVAWLICLNADWSSGSTLWNAAILTLAMGSAMSLYGCGAILLKYEEGILLKGILLSRLKKFS